MVSKEPCLTYEDLSMVCSSLKFIINNFWPDDVDADDINVMSDDASFD